MVQWILQKNHPNLGTIREMTYVLDGLGFPFTQVELKGRSDEIPELPGIDEKLPLVCYGPSFVPRALHHPTLSSGIFFDPVKFRWSAFNDGWNGRMISSGHILTVSQAREALRAGEAFVRPDEDNKAFDGSVFDLRSFDEMAGASSSRVTPETPVVVAAPVAIQAEWRTFLVDGQVVGASSYRIGPEVNLSGFVPHAVIDLAFEAAAEWSPARIFCLDIALSEGRYGIVEANCFNASRFYGADARTVIEAVSGAISP